MAGSSKRQRGSARPPRASAASQAPALSDSDRPAKRPREASTGAAASRSPGGASETKPGAQQDNSTVAHAAKATKCTSTLDANSAPSVLEGGEGATTDSDAANAAEPALEPMQHRWLGTLLSQTLLFPHICVRGPQISVGGSATCHIRLSNASPGFICRLEESTLDDKAGVRLFALAEGYVRHNNKQLAIDEAVVLQEGDEVRWSGPWGCAVYVFKPFPLTAPAEECGMTAPGPSTGARAPQGTLGSAERDAGPALTGQQASGRHCTVPEVPPGRVSPSCTAPPGLVADAPFSDAHSLRVIGTTHASLLSKLQQVTQVTWPHGPPAGPRRPRPPGPLGPPAGAAEAAGQIKNLICDIYFAGTGLRPVEIGGSVRPQGAPGAGASQEDGVALLRQRMQLLLGSGASPAACRVAEGLAPLLRMVEAATGEGVPSAGPTETRRGPAAAEIHGSAKHAVIADFDPGASSSSTAAAGLHAKQVDAFSEQLLKAVEQPKDLDVTLDDFPHYLAASAKQHLLSAAYVHLKRSEFARHTGPLSAMSNKILLTGPFGSDIYQEKLARALAKQLSASVLVYDHALLLSDIVSDDDSDEGVTEGDEEEDFDIFHDDDRDKGDVGQLWRPVPGASSRAVKAATRVPATSGRSAVRRGCRTGTKAKGAALPGQQLKLGDRIRYVGPAREGWPSAASLAGLQNALGAAGVFCMPGRREPGRDSKGPWVGLRGRVLVLPDDNPRKLVGVRFDHAFPNGTTLDKRCEAGHGFFCNPNEIRHEAAANKADEAHAAALDALFDCIAKLARQGPLVVLVKDVDKTLLDDGVVLTERYLQFTKRLEAMTGTVLLIGSHSADVRRDKGGGLINLNNRFGNSSLLDLGLSFEVLPRFDERGRNEPTSRAVKLLLRLMPNRVALITPQEEPLAGQWKKMLDSDIASMRESNNRQQVRSLLLRCHLECRELEQLVIRDQALTSEGVEKVVGWAIAHHLMQQAEQEERTDRNGGSAEQQTGENGLLGGNDVKQKEEPEAQGAGAPEVASKEGTMGKGPEGHAVEIAQVDGPSTNAVGSVAAPASPVVGCRVAADGHGLTTESCPMDSEANGPHLENNAAAVAAAAVAVVVASTLCPSGMELEGATPGHQGPLQGVHETGDLASVAADVQMDGNAKGHVAGMSTAAFVAKTADSVDMEVDQHGAVAQEGSKLRKARSQEQDGVMSKLQLPVASLQVAFDKLRQMQAEVQPAKNSLKDIQTDNEFEKRLLTEVIPADEVGVGFNDIGALDDVKRTLKEVVMLPLQRPELFLKGSLTKPTKGVLLFGPPGTGKTMLAKAVACESGANFINASMSALASKWFGEGEKFVRALFSLAHKIAPSVIFIDEVDSLLGRRDKHGEHEAMRKIKNQFMSDWDGLRTCERDRVLVLAATNRPMDLDEAVIRRMPRRIFVDLPDAVNRERVLKVILKEEQLEEGFDFEELARLTDGYSGSDLRNLCVAAAYRPIRDFLAAEEKTKEAGGGEGASERKQPAESADLKAKRPPVTNIVAAKDGIRGTDAVTSAAQGGAVDRVVDGGAGDGPRANGQGGAEGLAGAGGTKPVALRALNLQDFVAAMEQVGASVAQEATNMSELRQWNESYGEGGSRKKTPLPYFM